MWKKISTKILLDHPRLLVSEDEVELPSGAHINYLRYGSKNTSIMAICMDERKILVQQEYSYPPNEVLYQFPGGKVEYGEDLEVALNRELSEESMLQSKEIISIGWFYMDNRRNDNKMHVYLVKNTYESKNHQADMEEHISSNWLPIAKIDQMIKEGKIVNYTFLAGWALFKAHPQ